MDSWRKDYDFKDIPMIKIGVLKFLKKGFFARAYPFSFNSERFLRSK